MDLIHPDLGYCGNLADLTETPPTNARGAESYAVVIATMWVRGNAVLIVESQRKELRNELL